MDEEVGWSQDSQIFSQDPRSHKRKLEEEGDEESGKLKRKEDSQSVGGSKEGVKKEERREEEERRERQDEVGKGIGDELKCQATERKQC